MTDFVFPADVPPPPLEPGVAYGKCLRALNRVRGDYESAQVYALLSLNETLQKVAVQLAELNASIRRAEQ
jgi:hypothetical protein